MACSSITMSGLGISCKNSVGGIKKIYAIPSDDVTGVTVDEDGFIDAITVATSKKFKTFLMNAETGGFVSTMNTDAKTGGMYFSSVISAQFAKNTTQKRIEFMALAQLDMVVVVLDNNGKYWYFGMDNAVYATGGTWSSGTAFADLNGATIELTDMSRELPYEVQITNFETSLCDAAPVTE